MFDFLGVLNTLNNAERMAEQLSISRLVKNIKMVEECILLGYTI
jgi:hypothetical protein